MKKLNLIIIIIVIFFSSCTKEIDFTVSEEEKRIVLNGLINPDSIIKINISKSLGVLEEDSIVHFISNAEVKLFEDALFVENLKHDSMGYYNSTTYPKIGKKYKIVVSVSGLETAWAETIIPIPVEMTVIEQFVEITDTSFHDTLYKMVYADVIFSFTDPVAEENYYSFNFYSVISNIHISTVGHYNEDTDEYFEYEYLNYSEKKMQRLWGDTDNEMIYRNSVSGANLSQIFHDKIINGQQQVFEYYVYYNTFELETIYLSFATVSKELYNYYDSEILYYNSEYNPFAEPVNVYSNVENGYGIFSSFATSTDSICF